MVDLTTTGLDGATILVSISDGRLQTRTAVALDLGLSESSESLSIVMAEAEDAPVGRSDTWLREDLAMTRLVERPTAVRYGWPNFVRHGLPTLAGRERHSCLEV